MKLKVFEAFAGYGSQAMALSRQLYRGILSLSHLSENVY